MAFSNLSFETSDGHGGAASWTLTTRDSARSIAPFVTAALPAPWENFEQKWSSNEGFVFAFVAGSTVSAHFTTIKPNPKYVEDFEEGWSTNEGFVTSLTSSPATFTHGTLPSSFYETFEGGGSSDDVFLYSFVTLASASFLGSGAGGATSTHETFEGSWMTPAFKYAFTGVGTDLTAASFVTSGASVAFEAFETAWVGFAMTSV